MGCSETLGKSKYFQPHARIRGNRTHRLHALSLIAIGAAIAWLVKRKATGLKAFMKILAVVCAAIGLMLTILTVTFFLSTFDHALPSLYRDMANLL